MPVPATMSVLQHSKCISHTFLELAKFEHSGVEIGVCCFQLHFSRVANKFDLIFQILVSELTSFDISMSGNM